MIRYTSSKQLSLDGFILPFGGKLNPENRWVKWSRIIKHKLNLSDEETVLQIQENPYHQYFVGFSSYTDQPPFTPSLFAGFEQAILDKIDTPRRAAIAPYANHGKLLMDATVAEQAIRYPTDLSLLNEARVISEKLIDELYAPSDSTKKPRTYRRKARKQYLAIAKNKKPSLKVRRRGPQDQCQHDGWVGICRSYRLGCVQ